MVDFSPQRRVVGLAATVTEAGGPITVTIDALADVSRVRNLDKTAMVAAPGVGIRDTGVRVAVQDGSGHRADHACGVISTSKMLP